MLRSCGLFKVLCFQSGLRWRYKKRGKFLAGVTKRSSRQTVRVLVFGSALQALWATRRYFLRSKELRHVKLPTQKHFARLPAARRIDVHFDAIGMELGI
jgi:hypothetical protein